MGNTRLGPLPRTKPWVQVVALIDCGAGAEQVASATISAAEKGLLLALKDPGLLESLWLLMRLTRAARGDQYLPALRHAGLDLEQPPTLLELTCGFTEAVDRRLRELRTSSDLGEMAEMAAVETLHRCLAERTVTLFETRPEDIEIELGKLGTKARFSKLSREFFSRFLYRYLQYFLSRALPGEVGEGKRFASLGHVEEFEEALATHCHEVSLIVKDFSGGWFKKRGFKRGTIDRADVKGFLYKAVEKLVGELQYDKTHRAESVA